jgi:hypothetical protein
VRIHYGYPQITHRWRKNERKIEAVKKIPPGARDLGQVSNKVAPNMGGQAELNAANLREKAVSSYTYVSISGWVE